MVFYSDEISRIRRGIRDSFAGQIRALRWNFASLPAGNIGDVLVCGKIFAGETVFEGRTFHSAFGAGVIASFGVATIDPSDPMHQDLGAVSDPELFQRPISFAEAGETILMPAGPCVGGLEDDGVLSFTAEEDLLLVLVNSGLAFPLNGIYKGRMLVAK